MVTENGNHVPPWEPSPEIFLKEKKKKRKERRQRQQQNLSSATKATNPGKSSSLQYDDHLLVEQKHYQAPTSRENESCKITTSVGSIPDRDGTRGGNEFPPFAGYPPGAEKMITCHKKNSQNNGTYYVGQSAACEQCFEEGTEVIQQFLR